MSNDQYDEDFKALVEALEVDVNVMENAFYMTSSVLSKSSLRKRVEDIRTLLSRIKENDP